MRRSQSRRCSSVRRAASSTEIPLRSSSWPMRTNRVQKSTGSRVAQTDGSGGLKGGFAQAPANRRGRSGRRGAAGGSLGTPRGRLADLALGSLDQPLDVAAMHDPQQYRQNGEQHRLRPLAKRPQREWCGRAGDKRGERRVTGEPRDREPEQAEADGDPPVQRDEYPEIGGDALAALEAEP